MSASAEHIRQAVLRIERLNDEIAALNADKSEVFKEAKGFGLNVKALRALIAERAKDPQELAELSDHLDLYRAAMDSASALGTPCALARAPAHDPEAGDVVARMTVTKGHRSCRRAVESPQERCGGGVKARRGGCRRGTGRCAHRPDHPRQPAAAGMTRILAVIVTADGAQAIEYAPAPPQPDAAKRAAEEQQWLAHFAATRKAWR